MTLLPSKRVSIVSLSLVKESSLLYGPRRCQTSDDAYALIRPFIENKDREHLVSIGLNSKNEPTVVHLVHIGTANQSIAVPRDILKSVLLSNATRLMIGHNHPSGDPTPSVADERLTEKLHKASELLGIELLDHLVIGEECYYSFREHQKLG